MTTDLRQRVAASRFARVAALPTRVRTVAKYDASVLRASARWLVRSREHTNFTFDLTRLNLLHLAWWITEVTGISIEESRGLLEEIQQDQELREHIRSATAASDRRGLADSDVRLHKRMGWYALVRALKPDHVVETGTDKGLGSVVLAAALIRNGHGTLTTIDINPTAGYLISGPYAEVTEQLLGDSIATLKGLTRPVDFFLHDSVHTLQYELNELDAVKPHLSGRAVLLSDNGHVTPALPMWAEGNGRRFHYWQERPNEHWYPGGGIGLAR